MTDATIRWIILENIATVTSTAVLVLGLYAMSSSYHALWGLVLLLNLNTLTSSTSKTGKGSSDA